MPSFDPTTDQYSDAQNNLEVRDQDEEDYNELSPRLQPSAPENNDEDDHLQVSSQLQPDAREMGQDEDDQSQFQSDAEVDPLSTAPEDDQSWVGLVKDATGKFEAF